jgi:protein-tyrosine phosphatase
MELFWIGGESTGRLAIATRPRGADWLSDELKEASRAGVYLLVSMLTSVEAVELKLDGEAEAAKAAGLSFENVPIADRGVPERAHPFVRAARRAAEELKRGRSVAVHCRMGIGRSSMFAAATMIRLGTEPAVAWAWIAQARGRPVPDVLSQRTWIDTILPLLRS